MSVGRDNNLNLIRMVAASTVLVSHSFPITAIDAPGDPLWQATGRTMGDLAVGMFFVISGFLITKSFSSGRGIAHWALSRVLRMAPGLIVVLVLTVAVLGPLVTTLPLRQYFTDPQTIIYVPSNLSLWFMRFTLPGVFESNPYGSTINGSLWTLLYEVICYGGVLLAGIAGLLARRGRFALMLAPYLAAYLMIIATAPHSGGMQRLDNLASLSFAFMVGMVAFLWRDHIMLDWRWGAALAILASVLAPTLLGHAALWIVIGYATLYLAYKPKGAMLRYNRLGDYSYGTYIYAFPVQQLMVHLLPGQHWYENVALAFPVTVGLAILSWHLVEERALALVRRSNDAPRDAASPAEPAVRAAG